jgi:hypothetical protein
MAGERRTRLVTADGLKRGVAIPRLEVEGAPDRGVPPVSLWHKRKRGARYWAGGRAKLGRCRLPARAEKGRWPGKVCGLKKEKREEEGNWASWKRREREERKVFSFFKILFKFVFQTFKLQSNRNPCIRT